MRERCFLCHVCQRNAYEWHVWDEEERVNYGFTQSLSLSLRVLCIWERDREIDWGRGGGREREGEIYLQWQEWNFFVKDFCCFGFCELGCKSKLGTVVSTVSRSWVHSSHLIWEIETKYERLCWTKKINNQEKTGKWIFESNLHRAWRGNSWSGWDRLRERALGRLCQCFFCV